MTDLSDLIGKLREWTHDLRAKFAATVHNPAHCKALFDLAPALLDVVVAASLGELALSLENHKCAEFPDAEDEEGRCAECLGCSRFFAHRELSAALQQLTTKARESGLGCRKCGSGEGG